MSVLSLMRLQRRLSLCLRDGVHAVGSCKAPLSVTKITDGVANVSDGIMASSEVSMYYRGLPNPVADLRDGISMPSSRVA